VREKPGYRQLNVYVPEKTYRQMKALAARMRKTQSELVADLLEEKARRVKA
jgi:hypothetical protein